MALINSRIKGEEIMAQFVGLLHAIIYVIIDPG
jgi:hypothetical protein